MVLGRSAREQPPSYCLDSTRDWATAFFATFDSVVVGALADSTSAFATAITGILTKANATHG